MREKLKQLSNTQKILAGILTIGLIAAGGFLLEKYFLLEQAQQVNEELPGQETPTNTGEAAGQENTSENMKALKQGSFTGKTGHKVQGTVKIVKVNGENYLRFENYTQTQGPDVFLYLTPSTDPTTDEEIDNGVKIRINGGPDGGEITKEGDFNQKIPEEVDIKKYNGVGIWCDAFSVPFGTAELS